MLAAAGVGLNVRLEVYDDHDDGLHLSALAHPERHRRRMQRAREIFAGAANRPKDRQVLALLVAQLEDRDAQRRSSSGRGLGL